MESNPGPKSPCDVSPHFGRALRDRTCRFVSKEEETRRSQSVRSPVQFFIFHFFFIFHSTRLLRGGRKGIALATDGKNKKKFCSKKGVRAEEQEGKIWGRRAAHLASKAPWAVGESPLAHHSFLCRRGGWGLGLGLVCLCTGGGSGRRRRKGGGKSQEWDDH